MADVATDSAGNVYVADTGNNLIGKITPAGVVSTLAGTAGASGSADGTGAAARFWVPAGVATDSTGNVYVADTDNDIIRKITPLGVVVEKASANLKGAGDCMRAKALRWKFPPPRGVVTARYPLSFSAG